MFGWFAPVRLRSSALCSVSINRVDGGLPLEFTPLDPPSLYWLRHRSALRSSPCIRPPPRCTVCSPRDRLFRSTPRGPLTRVYPRTPTQGISAPIGDPRGQWLPGRVCRRLSWAERLTVFPSGHLRFVVKNKVRLFLVRLFGSSYFLIKVEVRHCFFCKFHSFFIAYLSFFEITRLGVFYHVL